MLTVDKFGRVVIPQEVREALHLRAGQKLTVAMETNHAIVLKVVEDAGVLEWEDGIPIIRSRGPKVDFDIVEMIKKDREERDRKIMGLD